MRPLATAILSALSLYALGAEPVAPPQWFLENIEAHTAGGGRWVADNSAYQGENEPFDAFVIEWRQVSMP